ncbi:MAG: hypothetical protein KJO99_05195 [Nitrosopumilus sp.]|nr:hypothetical protein [Nitrosopumilus sp.]NNL53388.1 hypothetical protein [Nitrosopumilus sp.]
MIQCPTCKLLMESHSTQELIECSLLQVDEELTGIQDEKEKLCPNCKHEITKHSDNELVECTMAFLKSV